MRNWTIGDFAMPTLFVVFIGLMISEEVRKVKREAAAIEMAGGALEKCMCSCEESSQ